VPREPDHPVCTADAALIVRKLGGRYQIVSGHNRKKAAANAGLSEVPCWVRVMTDDEARDELSRCNNQGELDPLEYGREAAKRRLEKGDNTPGGLSEYAKSIKRLRQTVTNWADAATVTNWADAADVARTSDCIACKSLACYRPATPAPYPVAFLDPNAWPALVRAAIAGAGTSSDTAAACAKGGRFPAYPTRTPARAR